MLNNLQYGLYAKNKNGLSVSGGTLEEAYICTHTCIINFYINYNIIDIINNIINLHVRIQAEQNNQKD